MLTASRRLVLFTSAFAFVGCSRSVDDPPPMAGYREEKISYKPPPLTNAAVVEAPAVSLTAWPSEPVSLSMPKSIRAKEELAFEGSIDAGDPKLAGGIVYVEFFKTRPDGNRVITNTSQVVISEKENSDGVIRYRVEVLAPVSKGKQTVELRLLHPTTSKDFRTFARGEIVMQ